MKKILSFVLFFCLMSSGYCQLGFLDPTFTASSMDPPSDGLVLWVSADKLVNKTSSDEVISIASRVGSFSLTNSSTTRPKWVANQVNGLPALIFNASEFDRLWITNLTTMNGAYPYSVFLVSKLTNYINGATLVAGATMNTLRVQQRTSPANGTIGMNNVVEITTNLINNWYYGEYIFDSTFTAATNYGNEYSVAGSGTTTPKGFAIGANGNDNNTPWSGWFAEALVYTNNLNSQARLKVRHYLATKYGLRSPDGPITESPEEPSNPGYGDETDGIIVAHNGSVNGDGSLANPIRIQDALNNSHPVISGAPLRRIRCRGGTYNISGSAVSCTLQGSSGNRWIITPYAGETVIMDCETGSIHGFTAAVNSFSWVDFYRIRFTDLSVTSASLLRQLWKVDFGHDIRFIHCQLDNSHSSGVVGNAGASNWMWYGCYIFNNGKTTNLDHGFYIHNKHGTLTFENNIMIDNTSHAIHGYNASFDPQQTFYGLRVIKNTFINYGGWGGTNSDRLIIVHNQHNTLDGPQSIPWTNVVVGDNWGFNLNHAADITENNRSSMLFVLPRELTVTNNHLWNVAMLLVGTNGLATGETIVTGNILTYQGNQIGVGFQPFSGDMLWDNNRYNSVDNLTRFYIGGSLSSSGPNLNFTSWQEHALAFDQNSITNQYPTTNFTRAITSTFDPNRVHVTIFNYRTNSSVSVDLTGKLPAGDYRIFWAYRPDTILATGTYVSGSITFPMTGHVAPSQIRSGGYTYDDSPLANAFIVLRYQ